MANKLALEIVTIERKVWEDEDLDMILLPGVEGELGILPNHAPLLTTLKPGIIVIRRGGEEELFAVGGGFADIRLNQVTVLAESAEYSEEIDAERAEEARRRAEQLLAEGVPESGPSLAAIRAQLARSQVRLKIARRRQARGAPSSREGV